MHNLVADWLVFPCIAYRDSGSGRRKATPIAPHATLFIAMMGFKLNGLNCKFWAVLSQAETYGIPVYAMNRLFSSAVGLILDLYIPTCWRASVYGLYAYYTSACTDEIEHPLAYYDSLFIETIAKRLFLQNFCACPICPEEQFGVRLNNLIFEIPNV